MDQKQMDELKGLMTEQGNLTKQLHTRLEALEAQGKNTLKESTEAVEAINKRLGDIEVEMKRLPLEAEKKKAEEDPLSLLPFGTKDYREAFGGYIRKGKEGISAEQVKALTVDTDPQGGYAVPVQRANEIIMKLIQFSPVRELADVVTISTGDAYEQPAEGAQSFTAGWVAERASRTETTAAKIRMEKTPVHELEAYPFVSQKMLDDAAFNIEQWLTNRLADMFRVTEGVAFISGSGVGKPEGLLTNGDVTSVNTGDANLVTADGLIDIYHDLPEFYAKGATWLMKRQTVSAIRKLKDANGQYLWVPGFSNNLAGNAPASILGQPYREAIDMPDVAASAYPVLFGDFKKAYRIVDRIDIRVLRDPYTNKPYVTFYTTKRLGGQVVLAEAMRKLKISA